MAELAVGQKAPEFDLPGGEGKALKLAELRGKPVVVYFYPQDDTETCTAEAIEFSRLKPEFGRFGAVVIGISPDSQKSHRKFSDKYSLEVDLASDADRKTIEAYGLWGEKTTFGRTYMGVERATFLIDKHGRIARIWRKVRVKGHADAVLEAVKALPA
jgi:peroxiredoxin Q/BCP